MRLFRKICFVLLAVCAFLPAVSAILPQVVGFEGAVIKLGYVMIDKGEEEYFLACEDNTWADYLVRPLFAEDGVHWGVSKAFLGALYALQSAGVPLSTPMVYGVGIFLLMIVMEFIDLLTSLVMWIPRRISSLFERS